ncbi:sterol desaturase family protein [Aliiglaciecola sp. LCG003]|uniref:sterol desaturase family protein n=1 Tax=Aliiglaciecola sp. LCG003 TaxID=3053655 RepID=UPI002573A7B7|nr:sterol desaturase family protein [Aliiglaciecola sp. LCG003]WJG09067.1 sterol desaturase family protein [Aliiglaciecola sp. LCG003]
MSVEYILLLLSPLFLIAIAVELLKKRASYSIKEFSLNLGLALSHQATDIIAMLALMPLFLWVHTSFALFTFELTAFMVFCAFILQDFLYYWFHRASHQCNWLWAAHIVHHSSMNMNFSTALRQSLFYPIVGMWVFWLPLVILGFPPELVFATVAINLAFQFFVHTELGPEFKLLGKVLNTPRHHCLHHASNPQYIDKNYAGVLIIWDKLFGTFAQFDGEAPRYGVVERHYELSFLDVVFTPWRILFKNLKQQPNLASAIKLLFNKPSKLRP